MRTLAKGEAISEIDAALVQKGYELRFHPRLEAAFEKAKGAGRNRAIANYLLIYLAAKMLFLLANLQVGSQVFRLSLLLRVGIILPVTGIAVWLLRRPVAPWIHGVAAFAPLIGETALVMVLGRISAFGDRYVFAAGFGIFAQALLVPAPFRYCMRGLAVALTVFCALCLVPWPGHFGAPLTRDYLIFVVGFSMPALYERYCRERSVRREFLLNEINRMRTEDILNMNAHLERLSSLDALTGVFNRRYLDAALTRLWDVAVDNQRWIGVLMIDIDHFKSLNDTAGHQHGDFCLEQVAQVMQRSVRAGVDTVARYGGEEFVAILPDADEKEAIIVGERVRQSIEAAAFPGANGAVVTISAGAAAVRGRAGTSLTVAELVSSADKALYNAKRSGRNRVICAASEPKQLESQST